ncbi:hypothetical protein CCAX7_61770 [Capsulimonas corticalis]|uniref:Uncharacterized protein n=1 Tax=Capsulimonas corticalis TaxID=2219043 RepID=A0A402CWD3_9BACT|nr:hypothetical protein [Capsulimonas corticalis]BDI34126.1 hypothetical protein CCAX7_61770 [Capsulimonas corticalis]
MNLPVPTDAEVEEFAGIYERELGIRLDGEQAREGATLFLQLFYLGTYGLAHIEWEKKQAKPHGDGVSGAKE